MKQMIFGMAVLLASTAGSALAVDDNKAGTGDDGQRITTESGTEIIIRSESEKQTRGTLATEDIYLSAPVAPDNTVAAPAESRGGWYESLFDWGSDDESESDTNWYESLFGWGDSEDKEEDDDKDASWWWPFD